MNRVLFVCSGNTCRSPMAEAVFNILAESRGLDWRAESAGTAAWPGTPASREARLAVRDVGGDLESFRSRELSRELVAGSRLVAVMTAAHRARVAEAFPEAADRVRLLLEFSPRGGGDVADPWGGTLERYRAALAEMTPAIEGLIGQMEKGLI